MDRKEKRGNTGNNYRNIFTSKNFFSLSEKFLTERNKIVFLVILIIGIILMTVPSAQKSDGFAMGDEEKRLSSVLSAIEGCGNVSVFITYQETEKYGNSPRIVQGAVIVADGAGGADVRNKISEAVQAAYDLPPHKVRVYKSNGKDDRK